MKEEIRTDNTDVIANACKKIADLEWQLQEVAKDNDYYQAENKRLEEQIEKMKCCANCRHSEADNKTDSICDKCFEMCYWELKE